LVFFFRMLPCATNGSYWYRSDMSGSVSRISLACGGGGAGGSACVQRSTSSQRPCCSVDATPNRIERACLYSPTNATILQNQTQRDIKPGDVRLFRDEQVSCKFCQRREEVGSRHFGWTGASAGLPDEQNCDLLHLFSQPTIAISTATPQCAAMLVCGYLHMGMQLV
jgi:hypothetical protein